MILPQPRLPAAASSPQRLVRRHLQRLRQLAELDLPAEVLLAEGVELIRALVPARRVLLLGLDAGGGVRRVFEAAPDCDDLAGWEPLSLPSPRLAALSLDSELQRERLRQAGLPHGLQVPVWRGVQAIGLLQLHRGPHDADFRVDERRLVQQAAAALGPCLVRRSEGVGEWVMPAEGSRRATCLVDGRAQSVHTTPRARRLLAMLRVPRDHEPAPLDPLAELVRRAGREGQARLLADTAYGRFELSADRVDDEHGGCAMFGVQVVWLEPLAIRLNRRLHDLELPARQVEVALALALGESLPAIARRLGLSENTVTSHARAIYQRLLVGSRMELLRRLAFD